MASLVERVKKFSTLMFFNFVFSKFLVGLGLGVVFAKFLAPFGWAILAIGLALSVICLANALRQA